MAESQLILRCPYCSRPFEAKPPDNWRSEYSFGAPLISVILPGEVKTQQTVCENHKCRKQLTEYWYPQLKYFPKR